MSVEILEKYFGIKPDRIIQLNGTDRFLAGDVLYTIVPVTYMEQKVLMELYEMSEHMAKFRDRKVSRFTPAKNGKFLVTHENQDYILLRNEYRPPSMRTQRTGRKLARFHERGKRLQAEIDALNRVGQWKSLWSMRLDQMEQAWRAFIQEPPREEFDRLFFESFPYFMGLAENAIQYVTDTELDERPSYWDQAAICHERFFNGLWAGEQEIRNPFDWVYDHPSRDIAEWIRNQYFKSRRAVRPELQSFLYEYESIAPISPFGWRLVYARLLFPLHYFVTVEDYYQGNEQPRQKRLEEEMKRHLRDTSDYEQFLRSFYGLADVNQKLPVLEWL
ncbi:spore coat putative kinase YutH [Siminovitchia sp. 179-K 8D1 HS]|uniref:spore coat putative kinase YutH n=1 Tax=Siminovitchia sp. 179-K 8D1 HS TaxID=3142385 RepID=UPI00399F2608